MERIKEAEQKTCLRPSGLQMNFEDETRRDRGTQKAEEEREKKKGGRERKLKYASIETRSHSTQADEWKE